MKLTKDEEELVIKYYLDLLPTNMRFLTLSSLVKILLEKLSNEEEFLGMRADTVLELAKIKYGFK